MVKYGVQTCYMDITQQNKRSANVRGIIQGCNTTAVALLSPSGARPAGLCPDQAVDAVGRATCECSPNACLDVINLCAPVHPAAQAQRVDLKSFLQICKHFYYREIVCFCFGLYESEGQF